MSKSITEQLSELFELHKSGTLTLEEYTNLKKRLISNTLGEEPAKQKPKPEEQLPQKTISIPEKNATKSHTLKDPDIPGIRPLPDTEPKRKRGHTYNGKIILVVLILFFLLLAISLIMVVRDQKSRNLSRHMQIEDLHKEPPPQGTIVQQHKYENLLEADVLPVIKAYLIEKFPLISSDGEIYDDSRSVVGVDELYFFDINQNGFTDALIYASGEDQYYFGNSGFLAYYTVINHGDRLELLERNSIANRFVFKEFSGNHLIGQRDIYDGSYRWHHTSTTEMKYVFKNNDFTLASERQVWVDSIWYGLK